MDISQDIKKAAEGIVIDIEERFDVEFMDQEEREYMVRLYTTMIGQYFPGGLAND